MCTERNRRRRLVDPSLSEMAVWFDVVEEEGISRERQRGVEKQEGQIKVRFAIGVVAGYLVAKKFL
jgi:hypothetical protein